MTNVGAAFSGKEVLLVSVTVTMQYERHDAKGASSSCYEDHENVFPTDDALTVGTMLDYHEAE